MRLGRSKMPLHSMTDIAATRHGFAGVAQVKVPASGVIGIKYLCWEEAADREPSLGITPGRTSGWARPAGSTQTQEPAPPGRPLVGTRSRPGVRMARTAGAETGAPSIHRGWYSRSAPTRPRTPASAGCRKGMLWSLLASSLQLSNQRLANLDLALPFDMRQHTTRRCSAFCRGSYQSQDAASWL